MASGDPKASEVTIWTRVTPEHKGKTEVEWELAEDATFLNVFQKGTVLTDSTKDYTIKLKLQDLSPDHYYYYRFSYEGSYSSVGRTKTLPLGAVDQINIISVSCNAYESGYFSAFRAIANFETKIDAVVHLGDFIYEGFAEKFIAIEERIPLPNHELTSLDDYRTRYAQYRLDPHLQAAMRMHPFIHIWDDHEIANDAYTDGAKAHDPNTQGDYQERKAAAVQAFYEWVPIETDHKMYRSFQFGEMASLLMLDGRLEAKTKPIPFADEHFKDSSRHFLGAKQLIWLQNELKNSESSWNLIGNPVAFTAKNKAWKIDSTKAKEDWSGYPYERQIVMNAIATLDKNVAFLTGDTHISWATDVEDNEGNTIGYEIAMQAVTSANWGDFNEKEKLQEIEYEWFNDPLNDHLKYLSLYGHGFGMSSITSNEISHSWYYVDKFNNDLFDYYAKEIHLPSLINKEFYVSKQH